MMNEKARWKSTEFFESFNKKEYRLFLKKAFCECDSIVIYLNQPVKNKEELLVGRNAFIGENLVELDICNEGLSPFSPCAKVEVKKNYSVFEALDKIENWTDFYGEDEESDYFMLDIDFMKDGKTFAYIMSHYVSYGSEFGMCEDA